MPSIQDRIALKRLTEVEEYRRSAPEILDLEGAAKFLDVNSRTLLDLLEPLGIPCRRIGRKILFSRDRLVEWVRGN